MNARARLPLLPEPSRQAPLAVADELRELAAAVRRIGCGRSTTPESILIEKQEAANRLAALAATIDIERGFR
jgi:hypothetical protein